MCEYLGIGQAMARELLVDPKNSFTIRIGNRLYGYCLQAHLKFCYAKGACKYLNHILTQQISK